MIQVSNPISSSVELFESSATPNTEPPALQQAAELIRRGDYFGAADVLHRAPRNSETRNLLGVCLMRSGQIEQAVHVYRQLVLMPGSVSERTEIRDDCKRNFATALLLSGLPSGALDVLQSTREKQNAIELSIRECIDRWEKSLPFLRKLDWRINHVEPPKCKVSIDFEPGELHLQVEPNRSDRPTKSSVTIAA